MMWHEWWVWIAAGVVLAILEVVVSGYVLLALPPGRCWPGCCWRWACWAGRCR